MPSTSTSTLKMKDPSYEPGHTAPWSAEAVERLRSLAEQGLTREEIATQLGCNMHTLSYQMAVQGIQTHYTRSRSARRQWEEREELLVMEALEAAHEKGVPVSEVVDSLTGVLGRTKASVWGKVQKLRGKGYGAPVTNFDGWTSEKVKRLTEMYNRGASQKEMAATLGVTVYSVQGKVRTLLREGALDRATSNPYSYQKSLWTKEEVNYLAAHYQTTPLSQLASDMGRSESSLKAKIQHYLTNRTQ